MLEYLEIGPVPAEESCEQLGPNYDSQKARAECNRFIALIRQKIGPEPEGARLKIRSNPHDFGTYLEVACYYDEENEEATNYAYRCEAEAPQTWEG